MGKKKYASNASLRKAYPTCENTAHAQVRMGKSKKVNAGSCTLQNEQYSTDPPLYPVV
jgi:hypothetical protein